ncbi:MAG: hypothetical protein LUE86_02935, partial [Clostridiales bacterium]|nr:hypothetical protein [Clostridiales bacterium]
MNKEAKKILQMFQCDFNRSIEENFAQVLSENERVRLFFINEGQAFTDGRNIVVDPSVGEVFADKDALQHTEDYMQIGHRISNDLWYALRIITRGQNIHECLHLLYTNFPPDAVGDVRSSTKARRKTLAIIANIIEDAFIEAVGCSVFDNLEFYLFFERLAVLFSNVPVEGTVDRAFSSETAALDKPEPFPLTEYLNHMGTFLLYPMVMQKEPIDSIADYVEKTKSLFLDGCACGDPDERFEFSRRIFDIIEPLIPESEEDIDESQLLKMIPGLKTHSGDSMAITNVRMKGRLTDVTRRLFTDLDGERLQKRDFSEQLNDLLLSSEEDKQTVLKIVLRQPVVVRWTGTQFDCHSIHKEIELIETRPSPNLNLRKAYQNIYNKYRININSYNSRFTQLLKAYVPEREEKRLFGTGISSKNLADIKKRYWYRNMEALGVPDLSVLLLIDGSGSMDGDRRENAMISSVILHEVLKKQGIEHAIVEHRAIYEKPEVQHNILIDFDSQDEDKFNILGLKADEGTREGLSLYWA